MYACDGPGSRALHSTFCLAVHGLASARLNKSGLAPWLPVAVLVLGSKECGAQLPTHLVCIVS